MCDINGTYLLDLKKSEKDEFLKSFDFVCLGCDGVFWNYLEDFPNICRAIKLLENAGKEIIYTTNNGLYTEEDLIYRLQDLGVTNVTEEKIIHPTKTIIQYCTNHMNNEPILTLCSDELNETLKDTLNLVYPTTETLNTKREFIKKTKPIEGVGAVLLDTNFNLKFSHLATALRCLQKNPNCKLLVNSTDTQLPLRCNRTMLGMGGIVTMLKMCSGREPVVLGKPGKFYLCMLPEHMKLGRCTRTLFIGDNLKTDIRFGKLCGFQTLLVLSGVTTMEDVKNSSQFKPKFWLNSIDELINFFAGLR